MRKLRELMEQLREYNQEAEVSAVVANQRVDFSLTFGNSEGTTKANCKTVSLYIDKLNGNDEDEDEDDDEEYQIRRSWDFTDFDPI